MSRGAIRPFVFAALASFVALHWAGMVADPPVARVLAAVAVATATGVGLLLLGRLAWHRALLQLAAAALALCGLALILIVLGLRPALLMPGEWAQLANGVDVGLAGIGEGVDYPYAGTNAWSRLVILLGLGGALALAAVLAFWPGRDPERPRLGALVALIVPYTVAVAVYTPGAWLARGLVLLALVVAWLWLPALPRRSPLAAAALLALALVTAIPLTGTLQKGGAWVDYTNWSWASGAGTGFAWDHTYGPIDWARDNDTVFVVRSEEPNYWKASVLDRFDGTGWFRSAGLGDSRELPLNAERDADPRIDTDWTVSVEVTIDELRSDLVIGPGTARTVLRGVEPTSPSDDGTVLYAIDPLDKGDSYLVRSYAPDPTAAEMRAADPDYSARLARFTAIELPDRVGAAGERVVTLRRPGRSAGPDPARVFRASPYRRTYRLASELTSGQPTPYDAVKAVENHLHDNYEYSETPPERTYPLAAFLFVDRAGYCQQFSGAMALMLRMVGIPARIATGFAPGTADTGEGTFRVRDLDAHSWVEVYFNGIGWVPFDPTPPAAPAPLQAGGETAASAGASSLDSLLALGSGALDAAGDGEAGPGPGREREAGLPGAATGGRGGGSAAWLLPPGALLLLLSSGAAAVFARRSRRLRSLGPELEAQVRVGELEGTLRRLGWGEGEGATLLELERRLRSRAEPRPASYLAKLRAARYGGGSPPAPTIGERRGLRARVAAYLAMPPLSPRPPR
jgi:transglutaminase-like putative cysteine protease